MFFEIAHFWTVCDPPESSLCAIWTCVWWTVPVNYQDKCTFYMKVERWNVNTWDRIYRCHFSLWILSVIRTVILSFLIQEITWYTCYITVVSSSDIWTPRTKDLLSHSHSDYLNNGCGLGMAVVKWPCINMIFNSGEITISSLSSELYQMYNIWW